MTRNVVGIFEKCFCLFVAHSHAAGDMLAKEGELSFASGSWHLTYCLECDASTTYFLWDVRHSHVACMCIYGQLKAHVR